MLKYMQWSLLGAALLYFPPALGVELIIRPKNASEIKILLDDQGKSTIERSLGLGEDWYGLVQISGIKAQQPVSVELRYETSLIISDEGPHIALRDWKHFQSDWLALSQSTGAQFEMPEISDKQKSQFPFVSLQEVLDHIGSLNMDRKVYWQKMAKSCITPITYPCDVKVSKVWLKIFIGESDQKKKLFREIVLHPSLGS